MKYHTNYLIDQCAEVEFPSGKQKKKDQLLFCFDVFPSPIKGGWGSKSFMDGLRGEKATDC